MPLPCLAQLPRSCVRATRNGMDSHIEVACNSERFSSSLDIAMKWCFAKTHTVQKWLVWHAFPRPTTTAATTTKQLQYVPGGWVPHFLFFHCCWLENPATEPQEALVCLVRPRRTLKRPVSRPRLRGHSSCGASSRPPPAARAAARSRQTSLQRWAQQPTARTWMESGLAHIRGWAWGKEISLPTVKIRQPPCVIW